MKSVLLPNYQDTADTVRRSHTTSLGSLAYIAIHFGERIAFLCSGVVITKTTVLTTSSCLAEHRYFVVRLVDKQTQYNISDVLKHETYNLTDKTKDIALSMDKSNPYANCAEHDLSS
ncbi:hypothetical protein quinque_010398 [Culex quinquefasciatus]